MFNEQINSTFNLHLQCFNHINEINSLISSLAENNNPSMHELESISNEIHRLLIKVDCYIFMQAHDLNIMNRVPEGFKKNAH